MNARPIEIDLDFKSHDGRADIGASIYIRSLTQFEGTIDYVGTAGEGNKSRLNARLARHQSNFRNARETHLRNTPDGPSTFENYLVILQDVANSNYSSRLIYIPGMAKTYEAIPGESIAYALKNWCFYVAFPSPPILDDLQAAFGHKRLGLKAIESHLQTLLRTFYVRISGNERFPLASVIPKGDGDASSTRSTILGASVGSDYADRIRIRSLTLPFSGSFSERFCAFVQDAAKRELKRHPQNPLIYDLST